MAEEKDITVPDNFPSKEYIARYGRPKKTDRNALFILQSTTLKAHQALTRRNEKDSFIIKAPNKAKKPLRNSVATVQTPQAGVSDAVAVGGAL